MTKADVKILFWAKTSLHKNTIKNDLVILHLFLSTTNLCLVARFFNRQHVFQMGTNYAIFLKSYCYSFWWGLWNCYSSLFDFRLITINLLCTWVTSVHRISGKTVPVCQSIKYSIIKINTWLKNGSHAIGEKGKPINNARHISI
jgi:hypothetical protein